MLEALGDALPAAIAIAISPISIVLVILTLVSARAKVNGPAFAIGWTIALFALVGVVYLLADAGDVASDEDASDGAHLVQLAVGVLFFALAVQSFRKRPRPGKETPTPKLFAAMESLSAPKALVLGVVGAVVNPKNLLLGISGALSIAQAGAHGGGGAGAVLIFTLIASSTVLGAVLTVVILGDRTRAPLDRLKEWLLANNSTIMTLLFVLLGAKAFGSGLAIFS